MSDDFADAVMRLGDALANAAHRAAEAGMSDKEIAAELRHYAQLLEDGEA